MTGKRYTICVDFDGVLHEYSSPWVAAHVIPDPPVEGAIEWLREMCHDFDVVVLTTRGRTWRGRRAVRRWLREEVGDLEMWLGNVTVTATKKPGLIYLDDRAVRFNGPATFPTKGEIHRARPWNKEAAR